MPRSLLKLQTAAAAAFVSLIVRALPGVEIPHWHGSEQHSHASGGFAHQHHSHGKHVKFLVPPHGAGDPFSDEEHAHAHAHGIEHSHDHTHEYERAHKEATAQIASQGDDPETPPLPVQGKDSGPGRGYYCELGAPQRTAPPVAAVIPGPDIIYRLTAPCRAPRTPDLRSDSIRGPPASVLN